MHSHCSKNVKWVKYVDDDWGNLSRLGQKSPKFYRYSKSIFYVKNQFNNSDFFPAQNIGLGEQLADQFLINLMFEIVLFSFLKLCIIFVDSYSTELKSNQNIFDPYLIFSKNLYFVGCATLCSKIEVILSTNIGVPVMKNVNWTVN